MKISAGIPSDMALAGTAAKALEEMGYDAGSTAETQHEPFMPAAIVLSTMRQSGRCRGSEASTVR